MVLRVRGRPRDGYRIQYRDMRNGRWVTRFFAEKHPQHCRQEWNKNPFFFR